MTKTHFVSAMLVAAAVAPSVAHATESGGAKRSVPVERVQLLADVVVNSPPANVPAPAAPPPAVVPVATPAPVVEAPPVHETRATVVEHEQHNYMTTIAVSALMGGLAGALVGGSIYYLSDHQNHAARIGYWAAGGVLVGGAVGVTQVIVQEGRVDRATASNLPTDPAPTFRLALVNAAF